MGFVTWNMPLLEAVITSGSTGNRHDCRSDSDTTRGDVAQLNLSVMRATKQTPSLFHSCIPLKRSRQSRIDTRISHQCLQTFVSADTNL